MPMGRAMFVVAGVVGVAGLALAARGVRSSARAQTATITVYKAPT